LSSLATLSSQGPCWWQIKFSNTKWLVAAMQFSEMQQQCNLNMILTSCLPQHSLERQFGKSTDSTSSKKVAAMQFSEMQQQCNLNMILTSCLSQYSLERPNLESPQIQRHHRHLAPEKRNSPNKLDHTH
jgi:hypothetical protein